MLTKTIEAPAQSFDATLPHEISAPPGFEGEGGDKQTEFESNAEQIKATFDKLWKMYAGRRAGLSFQIGETITEDDVLATRYYHEEDEGEIEEVYWRMTRYSVPTIPDEKPIAPSVEQVYFIRASTADSEHEIYVDTDGTVSVRRRVGDDLQWRPVDDSEVGWYVDDFEHRAVIAAERHTGRSPEHQGQANTKALALLYARFPVLAYQETSYE